LIPKAVVLSTYGVAAVYGGLDSVDKGRKHYDSTKDMSRSIAVGLDTGLWQLLASVLIPPIFINRTCVITSSLLSKAVARRAANAPPAWWTSDLNQRLISSAAGLAAIPLIVHPIDTSVDWFMDHVYYPSMKKLRGF
jgi:mitochondrial fission process protein 1